MELIQEIIKHGADELGERVTLSSYSGRGMMGKRCMSVSGDANYVKSFAYICMKELARRLAAGEIEEEVSDAVAETITGHRSDSLGMGIIIYWPGVEWVD